MTYFEGIDLFAGAGGVTTGIHRARHAGQRIAAVKAAVNHDEEALDSHEANHPEVEHFPEDITQLNETRLPALAAPRTFLWASAECTNYSYAKGGMPRDPDSRSLPNHLYRYAKHGLYDYIIVENAREFLAWGPLDENGKPLSRRNGRDYLRWVERICSLGYNYDYRFLNAADYGAHTSRIRYFGIFARRGLPIAFPPATHSKKPNGLQAWRPVREVLDLDDAGESIFTRKKPLVERTLRRILAGLERYAPSDNAWIVKYISNDARTGVNPGAGLDAPAPTITTQNRLYLASLELLQNYNGSTASGTTGMDRPARTVTTKDRLCKVSAVRWIDKRYNGSHNHQSADHPAGTLTTNPKLALVTAEGFLMPTHYDRLPTSLEAPAGTITANRKHTYLVTLADGRPAIRIEKGDSPTMRKIKAFMAQHGIIDIRMRMLSIAELKRITGLPENYRLLGTKGDQKKFIGNAVPPVIPQRIFEALYRANEGIDDRSGAAGMPLFNQQSA